MKAREIREYFVSRAEKVDPEHTVDTFKHGDPDVEVTSAAVTWMLTMRAIDEAERLGVNLVVTHEPTFWTHVDDVEQVKDDPLYRLKRGRLNEAGLTVLRIHDSWDYWPEVGIGASLATLLGLTLVESGVRKVYAPDEPRRLDAFAGLVRDRLRMDAVGVMGDARRTVRRVTLAFGASGGLDSMQKHVSMKPDVIVAGELCNWQDVRYLRDAGCPLILTDHAASENPGMRSLARFIAKTFSVPAHFIETGPALRTMTG